VTVPPPTPTTHIVTSPETVIGPSGEVPGNGAPPPVRPSLRRPRCN
jgi:hypothetical protein